MLISEVHEWLCEGGPDGWVACLQDYKQFNSTLMDSISLQLKSEQQLFALQQHWLERVSRLSACF